MTTSPWNRHEREARALRDHAAGHPHYESWPEPEHPATGQGADFVTSGPGALLVGDTLSGRERVAADPNPLRLSLATRLVCFAVEQLGWLAIGWALARRAWRRWRDPRPLRPMGALCRLFGHRWRKVEMVRVWPLTHEPIGKPFMVIRCRRCGAFEGEGH